MLIHHSLQKNNNINKFHATDATAIEGENGCFSKNDREWVDKKLEHENFHIIIYSGMWWYS